MRGEHLQIDMSALSSRDIYKVLTSVVLPRPIAWVSTCDADGTSNLAPFSFFTVASREPPLLFISIGPDGRALTGAEEERTESRFSISKRLSDPVKDTLANIRASGELVVNVVSRGQIREMEASSRSVPKGVDEFALIGIVKAKSQLVSPPRVAEAPIAIECRLEQLLPLGSDVGVIVRAVMVHARPGVFDREFHVDVNEVDPVARMPGPRYAVALNSSAIECFPTNLTQERKDVLK